MITSSVRITALLQAEILVAFALFVMQNYLTDVWDLSFTHAAAIVNIWGGISKVLPVLLLVLVDALLGNFKMLAISSIAYSVGTGFVTMSTPPVFGNSCEKYEPQCIGHKQKFLLHTGMALIAVGIAGNFVCIEPLVKEQGRRLFRSFTIGWLRVPGRTIIAVVALIGAFALPYIKSWSLRFGVPACCTVIATLLFLSGWRTYQKNEAKQSKQKGSPLCGICRVFVAAASERTHTSQEGPPSIYRGDGKEPTEFSHTRSLRCLEKAAFVLPGVDLEKQKINRWKLCSVAEVEAAKIVVRMIPLGMTFIVCGVVSSIGNTYFIGQANHMYRNIGPWKVPLQVLLLVFKLANSLFAKMVDKIILKGQKQNKSTSSKNKSASEQNESASSWDKTAPAKGIGVAMIFSVLCCITAAVVETRRLKIVRSHGLVDKTDGDDIPMSVFWLLFQFVLLAGVDAFLQTSVAAFYNDQFPQSIKSYVHVFANAVSGLGFMCSVLSVYVVGKLSETGGKANWFQHRLNRSRLDRYYWVLTGLSTVNLVVFIVLAKFYSYNDAKAPADDEAHHLPSCMMCEEGLTCPDCCCCSWFVKCYNCCCCN